MFVSETYSIEDCIFYDETERSISIGNSTKVQKIYDSLALTLPSKFEWSIDMKTSLVTSTSEFRLFLAPSFTGEQPTNGIWMQFASRATANCGVRRNGSTVSPHVDKTISANTYVNFKTIREDTDLTWSINNEDAGTSSESWIDDYSNYCFTWTLWKYNATITWKNLKIKPL